MIPKLWQQVQIIRAQRKREKRELKAWLDLTREPWRHG